MDFELSEEQGFILDTISKFISRECDREKIRAMDENRDFPEELFRTIVDMGFCGLTYGDDQRDTLAASLVTQKLATISPVLASGYVSSAFTGGLLVSLLGSVEEKDRFGGLDARFSCALEEDDPPSSSVPGTKAEPAGDVFCINGAKTLVGIPGHADYLVVSAVLGDDPAYFIVDAKADGLCFREMDRVGLAGVPLYDVDLPDVRAESILGGSRPGTDPAGQGVLIEVCLNIQAASLGVGIAEGAFRYAEEYARQRVQFGRSIESFGAIRSMLFDMETSIETARLILARTCTRLDSGMDVVRDSRRAKILAIEAARRSSIDCVQILGGYGYANEYDAQRYLRDAMSIVDCGLPGCVLRTLDE